MTSETAVTGTMSNLNDGQEHFLALQFSLVSEREHFDIPGTVMQVLTISSNIVHSQQQAVRRHLGPLWDFMPLMLTIAAIAACLTLVILLGARKRCSQQSWSEPSSAASSPRAAGNLQKSLLPL